MSSTGCSIPIHVPLILVSHFLFLFMMISARHRGKSTSICKFDKIYQFGDSISDTGNIIHEVPWATFGRLPYGQNFLKGATGRCSNGLLMIDFIAMAVKVPLLLPIKMMYGDFRNGANFAVAGATALSAQVLAQRNIHPPMTQSSLDVQLGWMKSHFRSICISQTDCVHKLQKAIFIVGEIGGNDYNYALSNGNTMDQVRGMVPEVVDAIINAVEEAIKFGAKTVMVAGNLPIGCFPLYKATSGSNTAYDQNQCIPQLNDFAMYHNEQLKLRVRKFKKELRTNTTIVYGDYYKAYISLLESFKSRGFEYEAACCGAGGRYNYNAGRMCGSPGVNSCGNPDQHISWDGIHLTQEAYRIMSVSLLRGLRRKLRCHF